MAWDIFIMLVEVSRELEQKRPGRKPPRDGQGRVPKRKEGKDRGEA